MRKRVRKPAEKSQGQYWFITFSDMVTLLLGFFIAIVSFSSIEIDKYRAALGSFRGALNSPISLPVIPSPVSNNKSTTESSLETEETLEAGLEVDRLIAEMNIGNSVISKVVPEGVRITLSNPILFDEGTDNLKPAATSFLISIAGIIKRYDPKEVVIEGHTDDTPIRTQRFPSNWELSAARALAVLKLFQGLNVPPEKLVAIGYGEFRPKEEIAPSATATEKGVNRRVEILLQMQSRTTTARPTEVGY